MITHEAGPRGTRPSWGKSSRCGPPTTRGAVTWLFPRWRDRGLRTIGRMPETALPDPQPPRHARWRRASMAVLVAALLAAVGAAAGAQGRGADALVLEAREAWRRGDAQRLEALRERVDAAGHPLATWVDYWALNRRLRDARADEVEAFFARHRGSYVEDRLRNDWLLELGRRRDWAGFEHELPRFRMNDDREVHCHAWSAAHARGVDVGERARAAWLAQRDADDGCQLLARTLLADGVFTADDVWRKVRLAVEQSRAAAARQALALLDPAPTPPPAGWWDHPERLLARAPASRRGDRFDEVAVARLAAIDAERAAQALAAGPASRLPAGSAAWAWGQVARWSAIERAPQALERYARAQALAGHGAGIGSDDALAWHVRAALREATPQWATVRDAIDAMSETTRADATWTYWRARAELALAPDGDPGVAARAAARAALAGIASQMHFYGKLAAEELGRPLALPPRPRAPSTDERAAARRHAGLARALHAFALGLRSEGVREWNFSLIGMDDRALLAAAELACEREVWDRCIHTSERTRSEIDVAQRFPTPFRAQVLARADASGVDPAYVYGLIRQESRFVTDARSHAGASGLMQLMPATARSIARRLGLAFTPRMVDDLETNLTLGTGYLREVLDDFDGSAALAAAAYNAGPARPRRWRDGPEVETAIWAESIPFGETRDYVKKVLSNAAYYAAQLADRPPSLRALLGAGHGAAAAGADAGRTEP